MDSVPVYGLGNDGCAERSEEYLSNNDITSSSSSQNDFVYQCKNCVERHFALTDCILEHALSAEHISVPPEEHGHHNPVFTLLEACENEEKKKYRDSITSDIIAPNDYSKQLSTTSNISHNICAAHNLHQDLTLNEKQCSDLHNNSYTRTDQQLKQCATCGNMKDGTKLRGCRINIQRDALDTQELHFKYEKYSIQSSFQDKIINHFKEKFTCGLFCLWSFLLSLFPVLEWLPKYNIKQYLISDLISGFTIAILHIPQGMAYGILASVEAVNGLYVSFFPVLIYFLFGTSKHISIGTFAVVSLMVKNSAEKLVATEKDNQTNSSPENSIVYSNENFTILSDDNGNSKDGISTISHLEAVTTLALAVGIWQLLMGIFRLGAVSVVLSDHLVSGFSTGAAVHVATSQIKDFFGISVASYNGPLKLIYTYISIFSNLKYTNVSAVLICTISIIILVLVKEKVDARFKLKMPVPTELFLVILATAISYFADFNGKFDTKIMGHIPTGFPEPIPPRYELLPKLVTDSFAIAVVIFAISLSMAKIFAKKHNYSIDPNQELIALGMANSFASFFSCYPCSASLSRSLIQEKSGGKTQVAGIISCVFLLIVLLFLGPLFYTLPKCILSAIILVALKGMFLQFKDFFHAWKVSRTDAAIWMITFASVVILDVDYGLLVGICFSLLTVLFRSLIPRKGFLGNIPGTEIYVDLKQFNQASALKGIKIFHFEAPLYFANQEVFKSELMKFSTKSVSEKIKSSNCKITYDAELVQYIIIDGSSFSFIDMSGVQAILEVTNEMKECGIPVLLAGCSESNFEIFERSGFLSKVQQPFMFPSIHDAVQYCHYLNYNSRL